MLSCQVSNMYLYLWSQIWYRFWEDRCQVMSNFILDEEFVFNFCVHHPLLIHLAKYTKEISQDMISTIEMLEV